MKRMISVFLTLIFCLSLAACGSKAPDAPAQDASASSASAEASQEAPAAESSASSSAPEEEPEEEPAPDASTPEEKSAESVLIALDWDEGFPTLEVSLSGTLDDDTYVYLTLDDDTFTAPDGSVVAQVRREDNHAEFEVFRLDGTYEVNASDGISYVEQGLANVISDTNISGTVSGAAEGTFSMEDGLRRSYTGIWYWAPFLLDHGELTEYVAPEG